MRKQKNIRTESPGPNHPFLGEANLRRTNAPPQAGAWATAFSQKLINDHPKSVVRNHFWVSVGAEY